MFLDLTLIFHAYLILLEPVNLIHAYQSLRTISNVVFSSLCSFQDMHNNDVYLAKEMQDLRFKKKSYYT